MAYLLGLPVLLLILIGCAAFVIHFLPTFVAGWRHVHNFWWILLLNFFFGWTLIGWIIALIWALNDRPRFGTGYVRTYNR